MPRAASSVPGGVIGGTIFIVTGDNNSGDINSDESILAYYPANDTWHLTGNRPSGPTGNTASVVVGNKLYKIGGYRNGIGSTIVEEGTLSELLASGTGTSTLAIPNIPSSVFPPTGKMKILNNIIRVRQGGIAYCLLKGGDPGAEFTVKIFSQGGQLFYSVVGHLFSDGTAIVPINAQANTGNYEGNRGSSRFLRSGVYWLYANTTNGNSIKDRKSFVVVNE